MRLRPISDLRPPTSDIDLRPRAVSPESPSSARWKGASEMAGGGVDVGARIALGLDTRVAAGVGESAGGGSTAGQE